MTTIAYRDGVMAADSRVTYESEAGGTRLARCEKLFKLDGAIVALAGEAASGLVFLDWISARIKDPKLARPEILITGEADFVALVLDKRGLYEYDRWCRGEKILEEFWAIGSGCKAALGALHAGASAEAAVRIACRIDPYSAPPVVSMSLVTPRSPASGNARKGPSRARGAKRG